PEVPNRRNTMDEKRRSTGPAKSEDWRFPLGQVVITPAALEVLSNEDTLAALGRHVRGDWGECCAEDWQENEFSLGKRLRLFSVYRSASGVKFWIITEADRSATTI